MRFLVDVYRSFASRWKKRGDFKLEPVALVEIVAKPNFSKLAMVLRREDGAEMHVELNGIDADHFFEHISTSMSEAKKERNQPPPKMEECSVCEGSGYIADLDNINKRTRCNYCMGAGKRVPQYLPRRTKDDGEKG